jgi:signal recognition particle subunit SRP54
MGGMGKKGLLRGGLGALFGKGAAGMPGGMSGGMPGGMPGLPGGAPGAMPPGMALPPGLSGLGRKK